MPRTASFQDVDAEWMKEMSQNSRRSKFGRVRRPLRCVEPRYHINLFWHEPDECWIADVPDLQYCSAHGNTATEAAAEAEIAIGLFIESLEAHGDPIPEPRYQPAIYAMKVAA